MHKWYIIKNENDLKKYRAELYSHGNKINNPIVMMTAEKAAEDHPSFPFAIGGSTVQPEILTVENIDQLHEAIHENN